MGSIPPNSILFFDVELIEVVEKFVDTDFSLPGKEEVTKSGLRMIIHKGGNGEIFSPFSKDWVGVRF